MAIKLFGRVGQDAKLLLILCLSVSVGRFSLDAYLPSLPSMVSLLNTTDGLVQQSLTVYFFGYGFSQFIYGPLSEKYGRKSPLCFGMLLFILGCIICTLTVSIYGFIAGRLVAGVGAGAAGVLARTIISDSIARENVASAWAQIMLAIVISLMVGPLVGAYIEHHADYRLTFFVCVIYASCVLGGIIVCLPETHNNRCDKPLRLVSIVNTYTRLLFDASFNKALACSVLAFSLLAIYFQLSPFMYIRELGYSPFIYAGIFVWVACHYVLGGYLVKRYAQHKQSSLLKFAVVLIIMASFLFLLSQLTLGIVFNLVALAAFIIGVRIIIPVAFSLGLHYQRQQAGYAAALFGGGQMLVSTGFSYVISQMTGFSAQTVFALTLLGVGCILGGLCLTIVPIIKITN